MSNFYLDRLYTKQQREKAKKEQQAPPPAESSNLGAAIEQLIDSAVEERVADAMEKQKPAHNPKVPRHLRDFTNEAADTFPPAPPKARPPMPVVTMTRGADGKIRSASVGTMTFNVERDGAGRAMRLVPED